jgi:hypothetical protein
MHTTVANRLAALQTAQNDEVTPRTSEGLASPQNASGAILGVSGQPGEYNAQCEERSAPAETVGRDSGITVLPCYPGEVPPEREGRQLQSRMLREDWHGASGRRSEYTAMVASILADVGQNPRTRVLAYRALVSADQTDLAARRLDEAPPPTHHTSVNVTLTDIQTAAAGLRAAAGLPSLSPPHATQSSVHTSGQQ